MIDFSEAEYNFRNSTLWRRQRTENLARLKNAAQARAVPKSPYGLVAMADAAEAYVAHVQGSKGLFPEVAETARRDFYGRLRDSIKNGYFEQRSRSRLTYISDVRALRARLNKERIETLISIEKIFDDALVPPDQSGQPLHLSIQSIYLENCWTSVKVARAWCTRYNLPQPTTWKSRPKIKTVKPKGRPPVIKALMDNYDDFLKETGQFTQNTNRAKAIALIKWFGIKFPNHKATSVAVRSVENAISERKGSAQKSQ